MFYLEGTLTLVWELCFILGHHIDRVSPQVSPHEYCDSYLYSHKRRCGPQGVYEAGKPNTKEQKPLSSSLSIGDCL